ncbi:hypothetical protein BKA62DRAFT_718027 [Auriculariales sp. MPI-PUGE-AT-0066]|nr:hypothetical protein BKA62DRAFT_718027 [Auriculariales sp. MPI-PUGE-AT-0066]
MRQGFMLCNIDKRQLIDIRLPGGSLNRLHMLLAPAAFPYYRDLETVRATVLDRFHRMKDFGLDNDRPIGRMHSQRQSFAGRLPTELLALIFESLQTPAVVDPDCGALDILFFAMSCQRLYSTGYSWVNATLTCAINWSGDRLISIGEHCDPADLPQGMLTPQERLELGLGLLSDEEDEDTCEEDEPLLPQDGTPFDQADHRDEEDSTLSDQGDITDGEDGERTLYKVAQDWYGGGTVFGAGQFCVEHFSEWVAIYLKKEHARLTGYRHAGQHSNYTPTDFFHSRTRVIMDALRESKPFFWEDQIIKMNHPVLRNLSKREYIPESTLNNLQKIEKDGINSFLERSNVGDLAFYGIFWSSDNTSIFHEILHRGRWAGDRFDIVPLARFKVEDDDGETWTDVSPWIQQAVEANFTI